MNPRHTPHECSAALREGPYAPKFRANTAAANSQQALYSRQTAWRGHSFKAIGMLDPVPSPGAALDPFGL